MNVRLEVEEGLFSALYAVDLLGPAYGKGSTVDEYQL